METFRPYATLDVEAALAEPTVERITALRSLAVRACSEDRAEREMICQIMNWPVERACDELGEMEYLSAAARVLFLLPQGTEHPAEGLLPKAVYRAMKAFFA